MRSPDTARSAIVSALDELGERSHYAQRTEGEPYPPSFAEERLEKIRRGRGYVYLLLGIVGLVTCAAAVGIEFGWVPAEYVLSLIVVSVSNVGWGVWMLSYMAKAEQLYDILHRMGEAHEPAPESPVAEVA